MLCAVGSVTRIPRPVGDLGVVLAELAGVPAASQPCVELLAQQRAPLASPSTRSITSMTRWKRSRWLSVTMSNGVVVVEVVYRRHAGSRTGLPRGDGDRL